MARKSRRNADIRSADEAGELNNTYKTAIYARLSIEDSRKPAGDTIESQVSLVERFVKERPYLKLCAVFKDNGESGANFDRPQFTDMIESVRQGDIDCIVVKDLSRFGRNYIETGCYLEEIFPFLNTRFISVNDNYDSHDCASRLDSLAISLKSLLNDVYAKDISRKILSSLGRKQSRGEFIGRYAAYGYVKSPEDKHKLVVDKEAAQVVRDIFKWKSGGMSNAAIARKLNESGIPAPSRRRLEQGVLKDKRFKNVTWQQMTIKWILKNPVYTGCMSQGKRKMRLFQVDAQRRTHAYEWINVPNMHEPIIDEDIFVAVNNV
ncbi:MAG: recombinase family protein [Defluviitaleaceae bacterium]|nr:recombinase family protein [Defluviitaleaceae bacterium]